MLGLARMGLLTYIKSGSEPQFGRYAWRMFILVQPIVALVAGILILVMPRLLNYIVALYLIIIGILGLIA